MLQEPAYPIGLIIFGKKRVGSKRYRRSIEVARFFIGTGYTPKARPAFESRVSRDILVNALERFNINFNSRGRRIIELYNEADFRRAVVFAGVRQILASSSSASDWIDIVRAMNDLEVLLWYTKFTYHHERTGYWGVYRVAKAIRTLYKL